MSSRDKIAKLEALLARVNARASERPSAEPPAGGSASPSMGPPRRSAPPGPTSSLPSGARTGPPPLGSMPVGRPPSGFPSYGPNGDGALNGRSGSAPPHMSLSSLPPANFADDEVEVSSEVVEVDIDLEDEAAFADSGAQRSPYATSPGDATYVADPAEAAYPSEYGAEGDDPRGVPAANELEEPAPSSSRRPIVTGPDAGYDAYDEESAPRHTPPPESGRQVAAPPSPLTRRSSVPPPLEPRPGPGAWREPGLPQVTAPTARGPAAPTPIAASRSGDARASSLPVPPGPSSGAVYTPPPPRSAPFASPASYGGANAKGPDVTRPELRGGATVASFAGSAATFRPASFGELLDASLSL